MTPIKNKLTKKGHQMLLGEFTQLSQIERPKVVQGVAYAAAEGDRSENAEYIYGKKRLREIDKRLSYLSKLLKNPQVVEKRQVTAEAVGFGCEVTVRDEDDNEKTWTIVGEGEADFKKKEISCKAPVAMALMGKKPGDIVSVEMPQGTKEFEIVAIRAGDIDP